MNHVISCTVQSRGSPLAKSAWSLGETDLDRITFFGDLEVGHDCYVILDPKFVWISSNVAVNLQYHVTDHAGNKSVIHTDSVMTALNCYDPTKYSESMLIVVTVDDARSVLSHASVHFIAIADSATKVDVQELP